MPEPEKDNLADDITAMGTIAAAFYGRRHIASAIRRAWAVFWDLWEGFQFEVNYRGASIVRMLCLFWMGLLALLLFTLVPAHQRVGLVWPFVGCELTLALVVLATWVPGVPGAQVRSAGMRDLNAFRAPAERHAREAEAAEEAYFLNDSQENEKRRDFTARRAASSKKAYDDFLKYVGPERPTAFLATVGWLAAVTMGFFFVETAMSLHMDYGIPRFRTRGLLIAGSIVYAGTFGIPMGLFIRWVIPGVGTVVTKLEQLLHAGRQGAEAAVMGGGVRFTDVKKKDFDADVLRGHDPLITGTEALAYGLVGTCLGFLFVSFNALLLMWNWVNYELSLRAMFWNIVIGSLVTMAYWALLRRDPMLRRMKDVVWVFVFAAIPMIPMGHFHIMGGIYEIDDEGQMVWAPFSAWNAYGSTVWSGLKSGVGLFDFSIWQVILAIIFAMIFIGGGVALLIWFAKKTKPEGLPEGVQKGWMVAFIILSLVVMVPAMTITLKQLSPSMRHPPIGESIAAAGRTIQASVRSAASYGRAAGGSVPPSDAFSTSQHLDVRCRLNSGGYTRCTAECFTYHHGTGHGLNVWHERAQGRCYDSP